MRAAGILGVHDRRRRRVRRSPAASRGTPRIANRLLRRVRDYAEVRGDGTIDGATARDGLALFGVDELRPRQGRPGHPRARSASSSAAGRSGCRTLAISVGEQPETVEDVYEPFLIQQGLLIRTPRGRVAMPAAYEHLGLTPPAGGAAPTSSLFDYSRLR